MTTLFVVPARELGDDVDVRAGLGWTTLTRAVEPGCASAAPSAKLAPTTGIVDGCERRGSVPTIRPSRSGVLPWLKMITAAAPAAWAFDALLGERAASRAG